MSKESVDVIVAGYKKLDVAEKDFEKLCTRIKDKQVKTEGVILVSKDKDGKVTLANTGDHLGRKGTAWGTGVGVVVGLFAPPMLASVAVGAAGGAVVGKFADHRLKSGIEDKVGEALPQGAAAVIGVFDEADRLAVEQALSSTPLKSVAPMDKDRLSDLKSSLAEAMGKFSPDRSKLPIPDRTFGGTVGRTLATSVADWTMIPGPKAPDGAPNVLILLIDDAGFGNPETFGGPIATPNLTRVQEMGITYNRFHVTAVCSATRAALLTGRNQHRVGFGSIAEAAGPFPGYTSAKPRSCAAFPRILSENGYVTGGFGKWHLSPDAVQGAAGPFDHWPQGWGFDHYYGFLSGAAGQYDTVVIQDSSTVGVPPGKDGDQYYFPDDLTDKAVEWLRAVRAHDPQKPWMMYYSTGCSHAPHQVAEQWADKYAGKFDQGWDTLREETLARQKKLGVVPQDAELSKRPDLFPAWDSLSDTVKKLYTRQMEVYAGFSENADWNVGRLLDAIEAMDDFDNTLIFYIWGDNGASLEGTITGSFNEMTFLNGMVLEPEEQLKLINEHGGTEAWGNKHTAPHYAAAWAHAGNAPFPWGKQVGSHLGGTRNPMIVAWPHHLQPSSDLRSQFTHCIDLGPTILEAAGIPEPDVVDGIEQEPMDGTSFLYTLDDAQAPDRHTSQYFEMFGNRAMYKDGWWACQRLDHAPWDLSPETLRKWGPDSTWDPDKEPWELYYLPDDFSQANNIAAAHQDKVKELVPLWWQEAERNRVLPLLGGLSIELGILPPMPTVMRHTFAPDVQNLARGIVPRVFGRSYAIEAELDVPKGGAEGVIVANSDFDGGFALWVDDKGRLNHTYSFLGVETYKQVSTEKIPTGAVRVRMLFETDESSKPGAGGTVTLSANDHKIGTGKIAHTVPLAFTSYAGMDVGRDNGLVVDLSYESKAPYAFTGTVKNVVFDLKPTDHEGELKLHEHASAHAVGQGAAG